MKKSIGRSALPGSTPFTTGPLCRADVGSSATVGNAVAAVRRLHVLDRVAIALALVGAACVASGLLPYPDAKATVARILPLLLFLGTVIVLAELTAAAEVFDVIAARV